MSEEEFVYWSENFRGMMEAAEALQTKEQDTNPFTKPLLAERPAQIYQFKLKEG